MQSARRARELTGLAFDEDPENHLAELATLYLGINALNRNEKESRSWWIRVKDTRGVLIREQTLNFTDSVTIARLQEFVEESCRLPQSQGVSITAIVDGVDLRQILTAPYRSPFGEQTSVFILMYPRLLVQTSPTGGENFCKSALAPVLERFADAGLVVTE
jgi:hypothetical protein